MTLAVFDTSAMMALMLGEPGADIVEQHLDGAMLSTVNLAEIGVKMMERGAPLDFVENEIRVSGIEIVDFEQAHALESARIRPMTKQFGLSLGDRACLALAITTSRLALTADRPWAELGLGLDIRLIR